MHTNKRYNKPHRKQPRDRNNERNMTYCNRLGTFKFPVHDVIFPIVLQNVGKETIAIIRSLFRPSFIHGVISLMKCGQIYIKTKDLQESTRRAETFQAN